MVSLIHSKFYNDGSITELFLNECINYCIKSSPRIRYDYFLIFSAKSKELALPSQKTVQALHCAQIKLIRILLPGTHIFEIWYEVWKIENIDGISSGGHLNSNPTSRNQVLL